MLTDHKKKIWILFFLIMFAGLIMPIFLGEARTIKDQSGGDPWRNIIFDFQTLFTGIMAVGAATYTIMQSRIIDERQQKRHEQMFELQIRPDKLRLARAYAFVDILRKHRVALVAWEPEGLLERLEDGKDFTASMKTRLMIMQAYCQLALSELAKDEMQNVKDLFDGAMHHHFNLLEQTLREIDQAFANLLTPIGALSDASHVPGVTERVPITRDRKKSALFEVEFQSAQMHASFDAFLMGFEELAKNYKVVKVLHL